MAKDYNYHHPRGGTKTFKKHIPVAALHAILDSDAKVIMLGYYPETETPGRAVVPVADNERVHPGYYYNRKTRKFSKEMP